MKIFFAIFVIFCNFLAIFPVEEKKETVKTEQIYSELKELIKKIEKYMDGINTIFSKFVQTKISKNGKFEMEDGTFYMEKGEKDSCKMRFDFEIAPEKIFILKKTMIIRMEDGSIKFCDLSSAPISHIFDKKMDIIEYFTEINFGTEIEENIVFISLVPKNFKSTRITLFFKAYDNKNIERFLGWSVRNKSDDVVHVRFHEQSMKVNDKNAFTSDVFEEKFFFERKKSPYTGPPKECGF
ncbi:MAG: outer membrane lipoprotein carrier protein LolA [Holosporales bacterium]|nr:outer membrane lipoprotein carrier protein LolA [Holosporales bacterium]